jgi:hypothetical protein
MFDYVRTDLESILQAADRFTAYDSCNSEVQALTQRCARAASLVELAAIASSVVEFIPPHLSDRQSDLLRGLVGIHDNPPKNDEEEAELLDTLAEI